MATEEQTIAARAVVSRLGQMRRLWENAAKEYFDPPNFLLNLQNCISVSRTVTFILQKHKATLPNFDAWYSPHIERMAADPIMKWAKDARNSIQKRGDLSAKSQVRGEVITSYYEGPTSRWASQSLFSSPNQFYRSIPDKLRTHPFVVENGTLLIERRWIDDELPDREVLDALAHVYMELAAIVADFCRHLDVDAPRWVDERPVEMEELAMDRALYISMRDGSLAGIRLLKKQINVDERALRKRYGDQTNRWKKIHAAQSLKDFCSAYFALARHLMLTDHYHMGFAYLLQGTKLVRLVGTEHPDRATRYVLLRDLAALAKIEKADGVILLNEVWRAESNATPTGFAVDSPDRTEALTLLAANSSGESFSLSAQIIRKKNKTHKVKKLTDTELIEHPDAWILYPFQKMWGCVDEEKLKEADERVKSNSPLGDILIKWD